MLRVLHIIDSLARTGAANQLLALSQGLRERGFDVHVAALDGHGSLCPDFAAAHIEVGELNRRGPIDPIAFWRLERLLFRLRPGIVHTWGFNAAIHGRIAARLAGVRRCTASPYCIEPTLGAWDWISERRIARITDRYVVSSWHVRDWFVRHGVAAEKFVIVPPGVPPSRPSDVSRTELLRELRLPADARIIGVIGRLEPYKRVKDLIWAADLLRVLHDNLRLLVIGDGSQRLQLEQYARMASDLEHIRFLGERADVWRIMPHIDVLWNADEPRGHAIAILEAMAAGVPVIASDTPFNRELVVENETGFLVPLYARSGRADRARDTDRIFTTPELAARLTAASRQRVAHHFSAEAMISRYEKLYS